MKTTADVRGALVRAEAGVGRPYPEAARRAAVRLAARRVAGGDALDDVALELGLSPVTLRRWQRRPAPAATFVPVELVASPAREPARGIVVHGPRGLRVEGLDVAGVAELVRRLG